MADSKKAGVNILLVFPDQWRPDWTPANAALPLKLPNLKKLIVDGAQFTNAITSAPVCAPSRACFALGVDYDACPVKSNGDNLPLNLETYYSKLRAAGYAVMACGKTDLAKNAHDWGIDGFHTMPDGKRRIDAWGFTDAISNSGKLDGVSSAKKGKLCPHTHFLQDHQLLQTHIDDASHRNGAQAYRNVHPTPLPAFAYADNFEGEQGLALLRRVPSGKNWFLQVNFSGPHDPEDITEEMSKAAPAAKFPAPIAGDPSFSADEHNATRRNYGAMLENIDRWLGIFRDEIAKRGEAAHTLVVFASDHGEMLGDHDRWAKQVPYQPSMGVPLVAAGPGVKAGTVNHSPVTLLDLAATFLNVAGGEATFGHGHSLVPVLKGDAKSVREVATSGLGKWRAAFDGRWKLIRDFNISPPPEKNFDAKLELKGTAAGAVDVLFDLQADPGELTNVIKDHPDIVARLEPFLKNPPA